MKSNLEIRQVNTKSGKSFCEEAINQIGISTLVLRAQEAHDKRSKKINSEKSEREQQEKEKLKRFDHILLALLSNAELTSDLSDYFASNSDGVIRTPNVMQYLRDEHGFGETVGLRYYDGEWIPNAGGVGFHIRNTTYILCMFDLFEGGKHTVGAKIIDYDKHNIWNIDADKITELAEYTYAFGYLERQKDNNPNNKFWPRLRKKIRNIFSTENV